MYINHPSPFQRRLLHYKSVPKQCINPLPKDTTYFMAVNLSKGVKIIFSFVYLLVIKLCLRDIRMYAAV
ncbi:MAG: hypothetical protein EA394_05615 [Bacteroidia bacterium]|nr:MAG: hypothetical protein EA394_05615 [Bacteroidia bacterium]